MEPVKIGIASVQDRPGGKQGAPKRRKRKRQPDGAPETTPLAPPPAIDPETGDTIVDAFEKSFVGQHINIVA